tara:strand:+ start:404 stop:601 length:198 start_codon:yes stop_codon:yes gene_type:complete
MNIAFLIAVYLLKVFSKKGCIKTTRLEKKFCIKRLFFIKDNKFIMLIINQLLKRFKDVFDVDFIE